MDAPNDPSPNENSEVLRRHLRFEELWAVNRKAALARVRKLLGDGLRRRVESADILQDVLLIASRKFVAEKKGVGMTPGDFLRWINRISENAVRGLARYHVAARRRSVRREQRLTSSAHGRLRAPKTPTPSEILSKQEQGDRIRRALLRLSPTEREVVELVHLKRWRVSEAAARLGKTANSTSVLLSQALKKLRTILEKDASGGDKGRE